MSTPQVEVGIEALRPAALLMVAMHDLEVALRAPQADLRGYLGDVSKAQRRVGELYVEMGECFLTASGDSALKAAAVTS